MKLSRDEVLMVPYKCCCFSARSAQGRIQGGAKIGHGGPLLQETSSSDRKATGTNQMDSNDLEACGKKCCYFWFLSEVKFLTRFWLVGWLVVLRINVDLAIFQPYLDLEAGDNQSLKIQVARLGIEPRSSCSASQELNHSATTAPDAFLTSFWT